MLDILINNINNRIIDVRMKNRLNEYIKKILEKNGKIKIYPNIIIKNTSDQLIIKTNKNYIKYILKTDKYQEKYEIFKMGKDYISEYKNDNIKQISVFQKEKEMIKYIEEKNNETTFIRTNNSNVILIENDKNNTNYYIGINENKYENYIPESIIYTEIQKDDYINLIKNKIEEEKVQEKYCISEKKLHLQ